METWLKETLRKMKKAGEGIGCHGGFGTECCSLIV